MLLDERHLALVVLMDDVHAELLGFGVSTDGVCCVEIIHVTHVIECIWSRNILDLMGGFWAAEVRDDLCWLIVCCIEK